VLRKGTVMTEDPPHGRASQPENLSSLDDAVRGRAFDVLLQCFADSVGADVAMFLAREEAERRGAHVISSWTREGRKPIVPWTSDSLLGRAAELDGAVVESSSDGDSAGHLAVAAGVSSHGRVVGAIYAGFALPSPQPRDELVWVAESYARLAGLCMFREDIPVAAVLGSAGFDTLTSCLSFGGVIEVVDAEIQRSRRHNHRFCCCMIDLDAFKQVNDRRGHLEGNQVLAAVGAALRSTAREYDSVGRFGGDEFVVVLPETGGHAGQRLAGRFLSRVKSAIAQATPVPAGASVGIVEWDGERSAADLLEKADRLMREAKASGGARVRSQSSASRHHDGVATLSEQLVTLTQQLAVPRRVGRNGAWPGH
jgi:diguanylate cyclase (GGDEF)-like protein